METEKPMKQKMVQTFTFILMVGLIVSCSTSRTQSSSRSTAPSDRGAAPSRPADSTLTAKVKAKLLSDDMLNALKIDVDTQNGTVYLSGVVDTADQKRKAIQIAKNTEGVERVEDNLKIGRFEGSSLPTSKQVRFLEDIG
jgi:hyperosmotically inducible protein